MHAFARAHTQTHNLYLFFQKRQFNQCFFESNCLYVYCTGAGQAARHKNLHSDVSKIIMTKPTQIKKHTQKKKQTKKLSLWAKDVDISLNNCC